MGCNPLERFIRHKKCLSEDRNYADFLHLDLIDETINKKNVSTDLRVLEQVIELWPNKDIQLHLMSTNYDFDTKIRKI